jgi:membrane-associated phospholipid phosphatase
MNMNIDKNMHGIPRIFSIMFVVYWFLSVLLLLFTGHGDLLMWLNRYSIAFLDLPMLIFTKTAHGTVGSILAIGVLLFYSFRGGAVLVSSLIIVGLFTNLAKRLLFFEQHRPFMVYDYADFERVVMEAPLTYFRSFPSGHTMTAFALATVLAVLFPKKWFVVVVFAWAALISFSRVYLCQHFYVDTVWGALFGYLSGFLAVLLISRWRALKQWPYAEKSGVQILILKLKCKS